MKITKSSVSALESYANFYEILDKYANESSIKGMPSPSAKLEIYKKLESSGSLVVFAAFFDETLIGYITVLSTTLPHYGILMSVTESFFVLKEHRKTGAGLALIREAQNYAKEIGSPGLLVSATMGSNLAEILPHLGYDETNRVFFKGFKDD